MLGAAFLDVTDPEPLPADHPLWGFDNVHVSMHLSGRSQTTLLRRGAERFLDKGPMAKALQRIPVKLVEHGQLGVIGATRWYQARRRH